MRTDDQLYAHSNRNGAPCTGGTGTRKSPEPRAAAVTVVEYRAEARQIGKRKWRFIPFTGAGPSLERVRVEQAVRFMEQANTAAYQYKYRIMRREKTVTTTDWKEEEQ